MITDPKVGDVVYLGGEYDDHGWYSVIKDGERCVITAIRPLEKEYRDQGRTDIPLRLKILSTGEYIPDKAYDGENGMWARWFVRDEFLTAARKAQKESKRAPRAKTA